MLIKKCNIMIQSVKTEKKTLFFRENANFEKHGCQYFVAMVKVDAHFMQCICLKLTHNVEIRNKQSVVLCAIGQGDLRSEY